MCLLKYFFSMDSNNHFTLNKLNVVCFVCFLLFLDEIKALHERVYNDAKNWFANLPLLSRVSLEFAQA